MEALPKKFDTWNHFYADFRDKLVPNADAIGYTDSRIDENGQIEEVHYRYKLVEIKAACFDEFMKHYGELTHYDEYDQIYIGEAMAKIDKFFKK